MSEARMEQRRGIPVQDQILTGLAEIRAAKNGGTTIVDLKNVLAENRSGLEVNKSTVRKSRALWEVLPRPVQRSIVDGGTHVMDMLGNMSSVSTRTQR